MSSKEHGQSPQTSHETELRGMTHNQRASSLVSQSRLARRAAAMAQMNALELVSIKAEMERLREENRSLRGIIQQLESLEVIEDSDDNDIQSVDGHSASDANAGLGYAIPIASLSQGESDAAILRNPSPGSFGTITYSPLERGLEHLDYDQTESEAMQLAQAIFDGNTTDCNSDLEFPSGLWQSQSDIANVLGRPPSRPSLLYEIPEDFDPDSEDYTVSDLETVASDQTLQAWGVRGKSAGAEEIGIPSADEDSNYETVDEQDEDNEEGWEAVNGSRHGTSVTRSEYFSAPVPSATPKPEYLEDNLDDCGRDGDTEGEDNSTVLGEPRSTSPTLLMDDDEASTVAETGSVGTDDERWRALMRDLEEEEEPEDDFATADLEKVRSEAELNEMSVRDQEYQDAIAQKEDMSANNTRASHTTYMPDTVSVQLPERTLQADETVNLSGGGGNTGLDDSVSSESLQDLTKILSDQTADNNLLKDLVSQFRDVWKTLTPVPPPESTNPISGDHGTVGWINMRTVTGDGNGQVANELHGSPGQIKENNGASSSNRVSESDRILQSFDPREDVIGILRPKAKGEKNTLNDNVVDTKRSKGVKAPQQKEQQIVNIEPVRPVGKVENQFRILKEERLQRQAADEVSRSATSKLNEARILGQSSKTTRTSIDDKLPEQPLPPHAGTPTNGAPPQPDPADILNWPVRTGRKPQFTPFSVKTGDLLNDPDLIVQQPPVSKELPESTDGCETELPPKKSIRFQDISPPHKHVVKATQNPRPSSAPMVKGLPPLRPLVSILKNDTPTTLFNVEPKPKAYNHEHIREVVIRKLPKDIEYSSLLDQVSGGLLEKVMIDWNILEARIVFAEPEAARRFYTKIEQNGFWAHTKLAHIRLVGKENLIQCTLGGFLWTRHSSPMSPSMIEGVWRLHASRCLIINDFPKNIPAERLEKDILTLFAGLPVQERDIIETVGIRRNLQVSSTGLMAYVRFTAITFAQKIGKELRGVTAYAEVNAVYDADPCGGVRRLEPPSVWGIENVKPEVKQSSLQVTQPQVLQPQATRPKVTQPQKNKTIRKPVTQRPAGIYRGQPGALKMGKNPGAFGRPPVLQLQRQIRPTVAPLIAPGRTGLGKTFADAARAKEQIGHTAVVCAALPPNRQQFPPVTPNSQQGLPPRGDIFRFDYNNWDAEPKTETPRPEGAHWNHKEQNLVQEYQQALGKKRRRGSDVDKAPMVEKRAEKPKPETSYYDRLVYLTNLPRDVTVKRLLRFVRGGAVEHLILQPPSSQYDTCKAIIIFIHRSSARDYKSYLQSPGLVIAQGHRVAYMEDVNDRRFDGIRLVAATTIRIDGLTRCLRADKLPKGTTREEVIGVIEEGMNHSTLEFEKAIIDVSPENKDMVVVVLRLVSVGRAVWAGGVLRKRYDGMILSYDEDPCQGSLTELEGVSIREEEG